MPGIKWWSIFERACLDINAEGNDIPDAYLAALAIENDCTLISTDNGFARFTRLDWHRPF